MTSYLADFDPASTETHLVSKELIEKKVPIAYTVSYTSEGALQNIRYLENGLVHFKLSFPIRCFFSTWTHAVVVSFVPLEAIRDPHVREWYSTFSEVLLDEAKRRLAAYPDWPYDGRTPAQAYASLGSISAEEQISRSQRMLRERGLDLTKKF